MTRKEYEERRQALREQHRAEIALLTAAHELRLRSLESLWRAASSMAGEEESPAAPVSAEPGGPTAPPPAAASPAFRVLDDLEAALPGLPEHFDRGDVIRVLGYEPPRTTLTRTLGYLAEDGLIAVESQSSGRFAKRYRKLQP